jgi:hypothetical protein
MLPVGILRTPSSHLLRNSSTMFNSLPGMLYRNHRIVLIPLYFLALIGLGHRMLLDEAVRYRLCTVTSSRASVERMATDFSSRAVS